MASRAVQIILQGRDNASHAFDKVGSSADRFKRSVVGALAGVAAGFSAVAAAKWAIGLTSQMENLEVQFTTMLRSGDKAKEMMADLNKFAAVTPFETAELAQATKMLLAFGVAQKDIIPTLRRVGDVSAALGVPLTDLAEIYGKARVQGRLMAEDVNQLTGRGIPIIQEFAKQFGVAETEVRKLVETGKIGFANLEAAFVSMTAEGSQFGGGMEKLSQTLSGQWSTLTDEIKMIVVQLGEGMLPVMKDLVKASADFAQNLKPGLEGLYLMNPPSSEKDAGEIDRRIAELERRKQDVQRRRREESGTFWGWLRGSDNIHGWNEGMIDAQISDLEAQRPTARINADAKRRDEEAAERKANQDALLARRQDQARQAGIKAMGESGAKAMRDSAAESLKGAGWRASNLAKDIAKSIGKEIKPAADEMRRKPAEVAKERERQDNTLSAVESRFLTRGTGRIDPMLREQQNTNRLLAEQNRKLQRLVDKRGLKAANL